jgi:hypothetical protein
MSLHSVLRTVCNRGVESGPGGDASDQCVEQSPPSPKPASNVLVQGKPQIDRHLPMGDFAVFDVASRLGNLKPTKVTNRFSSFFNSGPYRFIAS